ncbi:MAG TPA: glycine betaine ABC transporter substrate-binding protein, partial [Acidimicrobiia bacterium]|nr:glycine betaine ABC transporter substrate-binding protein [Acidimicrobiia bacterium]
MKKRIWILISAMALLLAACGDDGGTATTEAAGDGAATTEAADGGTDTTAAAGGEGETINIVANAWTASALNAEIAAQLIEQELGNPVEIVAIDENTMFTGLSDGSLDAVLEVWPSGVVAEE